MDLFHKSTDKCCQDWLNRNAQTKKKYAQRYPITDMAYLCNGMENNRNLRHQFHLVPTRSTHLSKTHLVKF